MKLSRSEPYVYWEDIPRRPNRRGEAWGQYYQRMREKSEDQRERVVSSLLSHKTSEMCFLAFAFQYLCLSFQYSCKEKKNVLD